MPRLKNDETTPVRITLSVPQAFALRELASEGWIAKEFDDSMKLNRSHVSAMRKLEDAIEKAVNMTLVNRMSK